MGPLAQAIFAVAFASFSAELDKPRSTVVFASQFGAALDSDLLKGGGTDDTASLQHILDRAKHGRGVHLVIDGPALVSGLDVYSNTVIECTAGGGLFLKENSTRAIIRNGHRSSGEILDEHISVRGCFINGNSENQRAEQQGASMRPMQSIRERDGTFRSGLQFFGVNYLTIENVILWDIVAWASWVANSKFIDVRNVIVDGNFTSYPEGKDAATVRSWLEKNSLGPGRPAGGGDDGLHFTGPIQYLTMDGLKIRTWDDGLAFTANLDCGADIDVKLRETCRAFDYASPYAKGGAIRDVTINNVLFMDGHHGIRFISADDRVDRIQVSNVTGTVRERFAVISHFFPGRSGNFGSITFNNVNIDLTESHSWVEMFPERRLRERLDAFESDVESGVEPSYSDLGEDLDNPLFSLNARIESLQLRNIVTRVSDGSRPIVRVGRKTVVQNMALGANVMDLTSRAVPIKLMGRIEHLDMALAWQGKQPIEYKGGTIGHVHGQQPCEVTE